MNNTTILHSRWDLTNFRYLFYGVLPSETMYENIDLIPNFTDLATPAMLFFVILEYFFLDERKIKFNDTITSMNAGMFSILTKYAGKSISAALYIRLYPKLNLFDLDPTSLSTWLLCFLAKDLAYYLAHRFIHEAGVFWSFHQMHHSSEYYNLSSALRQGALQDMATWIFDIMWCPVIPPNVFIVHQYFNVLYQFWLHTELVPYLGPLEYFLNTPSAHRVHHGRNPYCIDKNYGGTLIIWDRLFGSYARERSDEEIAYGLVTPVASFDQLYCQFFEFKAIGWDKPRMRDAEGKEVFVGWMEKLRAVFGPPGYFPGTKTHWFFFWKCVDDSEEGIPVIKGTPIVKYDRPCPPWLRLYLTIHFIILIVMFIKFNEARSANTTWEELLAYCAYFITTFQMYGYFFDCRWIALPFESFRLLCMFLYGLYHAEPAITSFTLASFVCLCSLAQVGQVLIFDLKHQAKENGKDNESPKVTTNSSSNAAATTTRNINTNNNNNDAEKKNN